MQTFFVSGASGKVEAEQLATFAHYIQGGQFRFVVTRMPRELTASLTHRASGHRVLSIPHTAVLAARGDYKIAALGELTKLIEEKGAARVASVLRAAEA